MLILRSAVFTLIQFVSTVLYTFIVLACFWCSPRTRYMVTTGWTGFMVWLARVVCGIQFRVIGEENLPRGTQVMACSKHSSTWETLQLNRLFAPASFIAKRELLFLPFFGWAFALASPITINRKAGAQAMNQMVSQGKDRAAGGFNIVIFPEGTRIAAGKRSKYKTGAARLAIGINEAGTRMPIVPIAHNAGYLWPKKGVKRPGTITLSILPPIDPAGWEMQSLTNEIERVIEAEVERIGAP
jgi:1-acyl-sn-glycerol-3-phosphate acyltransferase